MRAETGTATTIVVISGELDVTVIPQLSRQLGQLAVSHPPPLIFDLAGVGFLDCAAARLIVGTARSLAGGGRPVIRHPQPIVRRLLELTGLADHCEIQP